MKAYLQDKPWLIIHLSGLLAVIFLLFTHPPDTQEFNSRIFVLGLPAILSFTYAVYVCISKSRILLKKIMTGYLLLSLPLLSVLNKPFEYNAKDDSGRYFIYAEHMKDNKTLWGADQIIFKHIEHRSYATQPGYRYYDLIQLIIFQDSLRWIQFLNVSFLLLAYLLLLSHFGTKYFFWKHLSVALLLLLSFPAGVKNALQNLSEWLTVLLIIISGLSFLKKNYLTFSILLAFCVFLRQNLLPAHLFIFSLTLIFVIPKKYHLKSALLFLITLGIPLYHNLFYDGNFQLLVDLWNPYPFLKDQTYGEVLRLDYNFIWRNVKRCVGLVYESPDQLLISLFIPLYLLIWIKDMFTDSIAKVILYFTVLLLLSAPLIIYGSGAYYPRFQYVIYMECIMIMLLLKGKSIELLK